MASALASSVGLALFNEFRAFAKQALEKGDLQDDPAYDKILSGLKVAARQAGPALLPQLQDWRANLLASLKRSNDLRRSLVAEALFLEAALQLVETECSSLTEEQAIGLENLSVDWVLNAERNADFRFAEPHRMRDRVVLAAAQVLGALSPIRLDSITRRFLKEVGARIKADANGPARQEIYSLCSGLRFVRLHAGNTAQLVASTNFLDRVHPLKHVAPDKKSRLQQAICDMLTSVLQPLVDEQDPGEFGAGCDPELRRKWSQTVSVVRTDLLKWASKQSKQVLSGFPAVAALTCIEEQHQLVNAIDGFIDQLHKQLRDKKNASMALLCLCRCVACFLRRMSPQSDPPRMSKWVARSVGPVIQAMARGGLPAAEQAELMRQLCAIVAHHLPDYALSGMVLDLLAVDLAGSGNWEAGMAGLMALLTILMGVPGRLEGQAPALELQATVQGLERATQAVWVPPVGAASELLALVKDGFNPLEAYDVPHLAPKVSAALSRVISACHQLIGFQRLTAPNSRASDASNRERLGALPVFVMALQCVPFVMPDHWAGGAICDDLPGYTIHAEAAVRQVATVVLKRCMKALPGLRDQLIGSMATSIVRLPEDFPDVINDSLALLLALMREWLTQAAAEAAFGPPPESPSGAGSFGSLHRVEGAALGLLCSTDLASRRLALELLRSVRDLHRTLTQPRPPSRRTTLNSDFAPFARRTSLSSADGGTAHSQGRRASQHQPQFESAPSTPSGPDRQLFVADAIDRSGDELVQRCYWDLGRWSDLWRTWRPLPEPCPGLEDCILASRGSEDQLRRARVICELMKEVWRSCEKSAWAAHLEVSAKLQGLLSLDSNGRQVLPHDIKTELSRAYCMAVAAAPLLDASQLGDKGLSTRDFARLLVASARSGIDSMQQIAVLALGHINPACQALVVQEAAVFAEDYLDRQMQRTISMPSVPGMGRSRVRKDDARLTQAHIYRVLASNLPPGSLPGAAPLRDKLVEFVRETAKHITSTTDTSVELLQLRYCLCVVARACAMQLADAAPQAFPPAMRRGLFDMFALYCEEGQAPGQFRSDLRRNISAAKAKIKDVESSRLVEVELTESSETLEHVAYLGMAAMLQGPLFNADVRNPQGRVFGWVDRMLSVRQQPSAMSRLGAWGPPKATVARTALRNVLQSNPELAGVYVDRSYAANSNISAGYFQVLTDVYSQQALPLEQHAVVSLVLHKVVDSRQEVRDAARGLLAVLTRRAWNRDTRYSDQEGSTQAAEAAATAGGTVVVGALADSHASYQLRLSARLAKEHTNLSEPLAIEVLTRQLDNDAHGDALLCLCPWLEFVTLNTQWEGQWAESLLKSLYFITAHHSSRHAYQIQKLWATIAANRRNIIPTLDFLIVKGLEETMTGVDRGVPASVGKQVALYLSRVAPRQTIDHLVYELSQQLAEPEASGNASGESASPTAGTPKILEFHHRRSLASLAQSHMQALSHMSASRPGSRPATPNSAAFAQRYFTPGMPVGLDALLQTQSAWSDASSAVGDGLGMLDVDSRRSSEARLGGDPGSSRRAGFSGAFGSSSGGGGGGVLTRPELALCLLSEIAYEHDEEFRRHLPTLLHVATLNADSMDPVVRQESNQLLVFLLYSLACKHLEAQAGGTAAPEYARVSRLIVRLQALHGLPLWRREQPTLVQPLVSSSMAVAAFVQAVVDCFFFDTDLRERWCSEALAWACNAHCRHCASRSHQVFVALRPALNSASCTAMLAALHKCLQSSSLPSMDTAVEVLCTLRALLGGLDRSKVVLFPQLLLACVALLNSSVVRVGELAMHILLQILSCLDLSDTTVQNTLLAVLPLPEGDDENAQPAHNGQQQGQGQGLEDLWPLGHALLSGVAEVDEDALGPWVALPQLVIKALFQPETELLALEVLAAISRQVASSEPPARKGGGRSAGSLAGGGGAAMFSCLSLASSLADSGRRGLPVEVAVGDAEIGLAITLGATLPWLCIHLREAASADIVACFLEATAGACAAVGWPDLSSSVAALASLQQTGTDAAAWLPPFCESLCGAMFPSYARLIFQRLMETTQRGSEQHQQAAIAVMRAMFEVPGVDLGSAAWVAEDSRLTQLLSGLLGGPLAPQVLVLFQAMLRYQGGVHPDEDLDLGEQVLEWPHCMDDLGELNKLCSGALGRVVEPWVPPLSKGPEVLPFLKAKT